MVFKVKDHYYKKAKSENYFARSIYKLEEIQQKYKVLKRGDQVIDFGYYPGSWIQYTSKVVGKEGKIIGVDTQEINNKLMTLGNVELFCHDIFELQGPQDLSLEKAFHVVLSDMAPNTTGIRSVDQDRSLNLFEKLFSILPLFLIPGGNFVAKIFEGAQAQVFIKAQKRHFGELRYLRPKSTRSVSKEFFVIGKDFRP